MLRLRLFLQAVLVNLIPFLIILRQPQQHRHLFLAIRGDGIRPVSYTHLDVYKRQKLASMLDPGHLALTQIAQHLALLQKMDHRQHSAFPELPQQIAALYEWFSARCRWKEKALTQRGLLVQAGDQSEQIFTRWRAGAYNAWSLRCV